MDVTEPPTADARVIPRPRARTSSIAKPGFASRPVASPERAMPTRARKVSEVKKIPTRRQTNAEGQVKRPDSPDLNTILANTPRPRRRSSAAFPPASLRSRANSAASPFGWRVSGEDQDETEQPESDDDLRALECEDGSESDSSIDLHTPLP